MPPVSLQLFRLAATGQSGSEPSRSHTRLRALVLIRWLAVAGQLLTLLVVAVSVERRILPALAAVATLAAFNLWLSVRPPRSIDDAVVSRHLAFDVVQLAILIGLTGGLTNPFALFLLAPATVAATILPARETAKLAALAVLLVSLIGHWYLPLPWPGLPPDMPLLYLFGNWVALVVGIVSVSFFIWHVAEEARRLAAAFAESRLVLAQEQRVAEVGALAAAVAHELNTPLGTMSLIAHELAESLPAADPLQADVRTLISQAERCNAIMAGFTRRRERDASVRDETIPLPALVELAAAPYAPENGAVRIAFHHHPADPARDESPPWLDRSPEILHGLGAFIENAVQFARTRVEVDTVWSATGMTVTIRDDGPGFAPHLLSRLGDPYISDREDGGTNHLGLGIFIAITLLARTGARVAFANAQGPGAVVTVAWESVGE